MGSIEGRNDLWAGRSKEDLISAESQKRNRCFTSLSYSADGSVILAGGRLVLFGSVGDIAEFWGYCRAGLSWVVSLVSIGSAVVLIFILHYAKKNDWHN